jgi:parallel beta-helix repeat protein
VTLVGNALYLIRGETSADGWPFNESRGLINNGNFARFVPETGEVQNLPGVPFSIGKGSTAIYLNGYLYVTQGDSLTVADDSDNVEPLNGEGIRQPGRGFARFQLAPDPTIVVTNTNDSGEGSLRWAIEQANNTPGLDTIVFNIPGSGLHTISRLTAFPSLTDSIIIDGTTQPGYAGQPLIELTQSSPVKDFGLNLDANDNIIRGLKIRGFTYDSIVLNGQNNLIQNNILTESRYGINFASGIDVDGTVLLADNNLISNNTISFNLLDGIKLTGNQNQITNNTIFSNQRDGVRVTASNSFLNNSPHFNNSILGNSIYDNGRLGINLGNPEDAVTLNDLGDGDAGANNSQNYPILTSVTTDSNETTITGTLNTEPNQTYRIEFFVNDSADPSGYGEGKTYLDFVAVTTDNNGNASFSVSLSTQVPVGAVVAATATDPQGNTSEFSAVQTVIAPAISANNGSLTRSLIPEDEENPTRQGSFKDDYRTHLGSFLRKV